MERKCIDCGSRTTFVNNRGGHFWYRVKNNGLIIGYYCSKCYKKNYRLPNFQSFKEKLKKRFCSYCGSKTTLFHLARGKYPYHKWYKDGKGGFWCNSCYHRITDDPTVVKSRNKKRLTFKDKILHLPENPRKGKCDLCHKKIGDIYINCFGEKAKIKRTHIHHIKYNEKNPLKNTIELCVSCHRKETIRLAKKTKNHTD